MTKSRSSKVHGGTANHGSRELGPGFDQYDMISDWALQSLLLSRIGQVLLRLLQGGWDEVARPQGGVALTFLETRAHFGEDLLDQLRGVLKDLIMLNHRWGDWTGREQDFSRSSATVEDVDFSTLCRRLVFVGTQEALTSEVTGVTSSEPKGDVLHQLLKACFTNHEAFDDWARAQLSIVTAHRARLDG